MSKDRVQEALKAAAKPTLAAMRAERKKLPRSLRPLITYLVNHLFDFGLNATKAWAAAAKNDHSLSAVFKAATRLTLRAYIERRRLEVADRMLRTTDLEIGWVSLAVGYAHHARFANAYSKWLDELPSEARRKPSPPEIDYLTWRQWVRAELKPEAAWKIHQKALRRYPALEEKLRERYAPAVVEPRVVVDGARHEHLYAAGIWHELRALPFEEQRRQLRRYQFGSTAFFDLLREESRQEGRKDRRRGIELAQLALESLAGKEEVFGERIHDLQALGWAWLGNAQVLALDFPAAEVAFEEADAEWGVEREDQDQLVLAEIVCFKGTLRMLQRHFSEAVRLVDRAHDLFRCTDAQGEARALIQRAEIQVYADKPDVALAALQAAAKLLDHQEDRYLGYAVYSNLATVQTILGQYPAATESLVQATQYCSELDYALGCHQIQWVEGDIKQGMGDLNGAEQLYLLAREGFGAGKELYCVGLICLELAILNSKTGNLDTLKGFASEAVPILESLKMYPETVAAVSLFSQALEAGEVPYQCMREVRHCLQRDPMAHLSQERGPESLRPSEHGVG